MKLDITQHEQTILLDAMDQAIASAKRAQKTGKQPQIVEAYKVAERVLLDIRNKVSDAK